MFGHRKEQTFPPSEIGLVDEKAYLGFGLKNLQAVSCLRRFFRVQPLTQPALQVAELVVLHVFVLAEEVLVDVSPSEQPHVRVVRDGAVRVVRSVQSRTLGLGFCRRHQEWNAEQPQQLLRGKYISQEFQILFIYLCLYVFING